MQLTGQKQKKNTQRRKSQLNIATSYSNIKNKTPAKPIYTVLHWECIIAIAFFRIKTEILIKTKDDRIQTNRFRSNIFMHFVVFTFMVLEWSPKILREKYPNETKIPFSNQVRSFWFFNSNFFSSSKINKKNIEWLWLRKWKKATNSRLKLKPMKKISN